MEFRELTDLGLIAALITKGYSPRERTVLGKTVNFVFEWDDTLKQLEEDYFNNRLEVDAQRYSQTLKSVKGSIYTLVNLKG